MFEHGFADDLPSWHPARPSQIEPRDVDARTNLNPVVVAEDFRINPEPRPEGAMTDFNVLRVERSSAGASLDIRVL